MDSASPVSAFAVYKAKTQTNHLKRQLKKQKKQSANAIPNGKSKAVAVSNEISENQIKTAAKKIKQKQEKKSKDLNLKKKIHKKKKANSPQKKKNKDAPKKSKENGSKVTKEIENPNVIPQVPVQEAPQEFIDNESANEEAPILVPVEENRVEENRVEENRVEENRVENNVEMADNVSIGSEGSIEFVPVQMHSVSEGLRVFTWMLAPFIPKEFFINIWEKKPLHVSRNRPNYYRGVLSTPWIDKMLRTENIQFTKNIDITSYVDGKRETHNPVGRAHPHVVWDYYLNGCSIRLLNPQTYTPKLHLLNASMQEFFNCFVGANAYLTPPDSQGFAPHYDDIEAFILQVEGKKHWKVYKPRSENETLPRVSSKNFDQDEIGEPILEVTLVAGDLLYFPRGFIHQGVTIDGEHSLHVTISMYQKHSWADLLEKLIPNALQTAINETKDMRCGLPLDIYDNFGLVNSDIKTPRKKELTNLIKVFCDRLKNHINIEQAVDEMAKVYQRDALPPVLTQMEKAVTVYGDHDIMISNGKIVNRVEIDLDTRIRLLRKNILRMVMEDDTIRIYYCVENSLEYQGNELQYLEIDEHLAPAVETLVLSYPEYVFVENLDVASETDKLQVANDLWERGLIMSEYPLRIGED